MMMKCQLFKRGIRIKVNEYGIYNCEWHGIQHQLLFTRGVFLVTFPTTLMIMELPISRNSTQPPTPSEALWANAIAAQTTPYYHIHVPCFVHQYPDRSVNKPQVAVTTIRHRFHRYSSSSPSRLPARLNAPRHHLSFPPFPYRHPAHPIVRASYKR